MANNVENKYEITIDDKNWKGRGLGSFLFRRWLDGSSYEGEFKDGAANGTGVFSDKGGIRMTGEWKDYRPHGHLVWKCIPFNMAYDGEWREGKHHGYGTFTQGGICQSIYEGEWKNDHKHGYGFMTYDFGKKTYEGEWKDGLRDGHGFMKYDDDDEDGTWYDGEWCEDQWHGHGQHYDDILDQLYVGEFSHGQRHGIGILYKKDADDSWCIYQNGNLIVKLVIKSSQSFKGGICKR